MMWRAMREFSRVNVGVMLLIWYGGFPRCVVINMNRVYRAVISMLRPVRMIVKLDQEKVDRIMNSSPTRLIVGGRARLVRLDRIHHVDISGRVICRPRASSMVRLWVRS